ncbi:UNVERIFIED_CONTAM: hypothetical protein Sradi_4363900 [Sesamum radiatum]|uniref:Uncharacterized protein n=1 Tax=Sesamum radiatum TaxID=300843 RepID=A0AAW2NS19_SESRA
MDESVDSPAYDVSGHLNPNTLPSDVVVGDLLDEEGEWNETLVRTVFCSEDVVAILGITRTTSSHDQLRWHYEKNGRYTVKSAYRLLSQGVVTTGIRGAMGSTSYKTESWNFYYLERHGSS